MLQIFGLSSFVISSFLLIFAEGQREEWRKIKGKIDDIQYMHGQSTHFFISSSFLNLSFLYICESKSLALMKKSVLLCHLFVLKIAQNMSRYYNS